MYDTMKKESLYALSAGYTENNLTVSKEAALVGIGYAILALAEAIRETRTKNKEEEK